MANINGLDGLGRYADVPNNESGQFVINPNIPDFIKKLFINPG